MGPQEASPGSLGTVRGQCSSVFSSSLLGKVVLANESTFSARFSMRSRKLRHAFYMVNYSIFSRSDLFATKFISKASTHQKSRKIQSKSMQNDATIVFFGLKYVRRPKKVKDERNIGKLGSEKRSLNDEVGPQRGDKDASKAQVARITLAPGDWW